MPAERYYIESKLTSHSIIALHDAEFHHLAHVMRTRVGDSIEIVNGSGALATGIVDKLSKKEATISISHVEMSAKPPFDLILAQSIPRQQRLDLIIEKGTELGMSQIWLFPADSGHKKELTSHQLDRLKGIAISAMKQCGRLYLPEIVIKDALENWNQDDIIQPAFFGDVSPEAPLLLDFLQQNRQLKHALFFVGPESGFKPHEIGILKHLGVKGVKLNQNILRTETAAIAALAILSQVKEW